MIAFTELTWAWVWPGSRTFVRPKGRTIIWLKVCDKIGYVFSACFFSTFFFMWKPAWDDWKLPSLFLGILSWHTYPIYTSGHHSSMLGTPLCSAGLKQLWFCDGTAPCPLGDSVTVFFWFWMDVYKTVVACFIDPACPISIPGCLGMSNLNPPVLLGWTEVPGTSSCYTLAFSWWKQLCSSDCTLADLFLTHPDGLPSNKVVKTICANHHWRPITTDFCHF